MDSALERFHDTPRSVVSRVGHFLTDQVYHQPRPISSHFQHDGHLLIIQPTVGVGYTDQAVRGPMLSPRAYEEMHAIAERHGSVAGAQQVLDLAPRFPLAQPPLTPDGRRL